MSAFQKPKHQKSAHLTTLNDYLVQFYGLRAENARPRASINHAHCANQHRRWETWFCFMCGPQRTVSAHSTKQQPALSCFPSFKSLKQYLFFEIASTSLFSFNCNNSHLNNDGSTSLFLHRAAIQQQWWHHSHVPCPVDHAPASREAAMPKDELGGSSCPKRACQCLFLTLSHDS